MRQLPFAVTALLLIIGAPFGLCFRGAGFTGPSSRQLRRGDRASGFDLANRTWKGAPLRVMFATERPLEGEFSLIAPNGSVAAKSHERHGGPPYFWFAEVVSPVVGTWQAELARDDAPAECSTITRKISVRQGRPARMNSNRGSAWPLNNMWNRATEDLYSAWIEKLFDAPLDAELSWPALHEGVARSNTQLPVQPFGPRRRSEGADRAARLRRPSIFFACIFCLQDGAAVRILEMLARRRRTAKMLRVVEHSEARSLLPPRLNRKLHRAVATCSECSVSQL